MSCCQQCPAAGDSKDGVTGWCHKAASRSLAVTPSIAREIGRLLSPDDLASRFPGPHEVAVVKDERLLGCDGRRRRSRKPPSRAFDQLFILRVLSEVDSFPGVGAMVIEFPFSILIMDCTVMKSPHGNMAGLLDGERRALAEFRRVPKPW